MKKTEVKKLLNAKKIELVSFSKKAGFTKEQSKEIINQLIDLFNNPIGSEPDLIKIIVTGLKFELYINNSKNAILKTLNKFHAKIQEAKPKQINAVTKHIYTGNNALELEKAGFNSNEWVGSGQAKKLGKQIKKDAKGVVIKVYKENEDGQTFCKMEKIYNIEELEPIQKIENTNQFRDMVNRFKNMFVKTKKRA